MATRSFHKGEIIVAEGSQGNEAYRILSGEVLICKGSKKKGYVAIARLGVGEIFGEMYLFDKRGRRNATVVAATDLKVELLSEEEMMRALSATSPMVKNIINSLSDRLNSTSNHFGVTKSRKLEEQGMNQAIPQSLREIEFPVAEIVSNIEQSYYKTGNKRHYFGGRYSSPNK